MHVNKGVFEVIWGPSLTHGPSCYLWKLLRWPNGTKFKCNPVCLINQASNYWNLCKQASCGAAFARPSSVKCPAHIVICVSDTCWPQGNYGILPRPGAAVTNLHIKLLFASHFAWKSQLRRQNPTSKGFRRASRMVRPLQSGFAPERSTADQPRLHIHKAKRQTHRYVCRLS